MLWSSLVALLPMSNSSRLLACLLVAGTLTACSRTDEAPIRVGILHSMTGTLAISARPVVDATLLAIEEINAQGGLLGRKLEPVIADGTSDSGNFALEAERLITEEKVSVVFGCWTSSSRKAAGPVFEKHNHLLFYPVQYEGLEQRGISLVLGAQLVRQSGQRRQTSRRSGRGQGVAQQKPTRFAAA